MKLTRRQKYLALSLVPTWNGACTSAEVRKWRKALAGTVHHEREFYDFVAFNRRGHRKQFEYCHAPTERKRDKCNCVGDFERMKALAQKWAESR